MAAGAVSAAAAASVPVAAFNVSPTRVTREQAAGRVPALDGLRGIAILLVLLWHGVFQVQPNSGIWSRLLSLGSLAWSGVDLFFVLSGFLIGGILLDEKESPRYFKTFYMRRAYRILPLYGLLLAIQICTRAQILPRWLAQASSDPIPLWSYLSFTQNMYMAAIAGFGSIVMTATWSLAIEEQFYLTAPLLVRRLRRPAFVIVLLAIVVLAPVLRSALYVGMRQGGFASYVLMPCRADDLCLGILVSLLTRNGKLWAAVVRAHSCLYWIAAALAVPLLYFSLGRYGPYSSVMVTGGYSLLGLFYTCCLLIALTVSGHTRAIFCNRLLMQLGTLAYCTYLVHLPLIEFCDRLLRRRFTQPGVTVDFTAGAVGI
jgi:peptidoglycan/LPS O-acetylase OafA/YrhL